MKFCYFDESGTGGHPVAVMAGVIADANRMHLTKHAWSELLKHLSGIVGAEVQEFHTHKFYGGQGIWRGIDGGRRARIISAIIVWMAERKHKITYSAVDRGRFEAQQKSDPRLSNLSIWRTLGLHNALALQRCHQRDTNPKGHTVVIYDQQVMEKEKYTALLLEPPEWTDSYYYRSKKSPPLDQLIDVPHFVDSKQVELVQVADLYAFILRRHIELAEEYDAPKYSDEALKIGGWAESIFSQTISNGHIYPKQVPSEAAKVFQHVAPTSCL